MGNRARIGEVISALAGYLPFSEWCKTDSGAIVRYVRDVTLRSGFWVFGRCARPGCGVPFGKVARLPHATSPTWYPDLPHAASPIFGRLPGLRWGVVRPYAVAAYGKIRLPGWGGLPDQHMHARCIWPFLPSRSLKFHFRQGSVTPGMGRIPPYA
jgi:hypothetical protein